jgi:hypothetical protein
MILEQGFQIGHAVFMFPSSCLVIFVGKKMRQQSPMAVQTILIEFGVSMAVFLFLAAALAVAIPAAPRFVKGRSLYKHGGQIRKEIGN